MPLWRIYANPSTFDDSQREGLAKAITAVYNGPPAHLPAFYVNVLFIPLEEHNVWVGGEKTSNFVRITVEHIARNFGTDPTERKAKSTRFMNRAHQVSAAFVPLKST